MRRKLAGIAAIVRSDAPRINPKQTATYLSAGAQTIKMSLDVLSTMLGHQEVEHHVATDVWKRVGVKSREVIRVADLTGRTVIRREMM